MDRKMSEKEINRFMKLAGLIKETWHPDDPSSVDIDDISDEDPEDFDDVSESDTANTQWYEDFEAGLRNMLNNNHISSYEYKEYMKALDHVDPMDNYGEMTGHDAAKEFVDDLRTKTQMDHDKDQYRRETGLEESGTGDEPFDFNKAAIQSASGDKISHTEKDDEGETIYWSTKNPNVTYYIGGDEQIIKYDGETGERYVIGDLRQYDEPTHDYEPDTDADYEEPRDDFDMAGDDYNDGEFWESEVKRFKEIAGVSQPSDGPEDDDEDEREARAKKAEMDDEEAENAERDLDEDAYDESGDTDAMGDIN